MPSDFFWVMRQTWCDLLFAHWEAPVEALRKAVPHPLEIDTYDGRAFIGIVPFKMTGIRGRLLPPLPGLSQSLELNVRTYVRYGDRSGVYFFSLDAESLPIVLGARPSYKLPYYHAAMSWDGARYVSRRLRGAAAELRAEYGPAGDVSTAAPGSLESFLTDRYRLWTVHNSRVRRAEIRHAPWPLQPAHARFEVNTMATPLGIELTGEPLLHFSRKLDVLIGPPTEDRRLPTLA